MGLSLSLSRESLSRERRNNLKQRGGSKNKSWFEITTDFFIFSSQNVKRTPECWGPGRCHNTISGKENPRTSCSSIESFSFAVAHPAGIKRTKVTFFSIFPEDNPGPRIPRKRRRAVGFVVNLSSKPDDGRYYIEQSSNEQRKPISIFSIVTTRVNY